LYPSTIQFRRPFRHQQGKYHPIKHPSSPGDSTLSSTSRVEQGPDLRNMSSCRSMHLRHSKASTILPFRRLWCLLMVIPADQKSLGKPLNSWVFCHQYVGNHQQRKPGLLARGYILLSRDTLPSSVIGSRKYLSPKLLTFDEQLSTGELRIE
jgi:hypothetical protein